MAVPISRKLIEHILLGSGDSRRQIQDSPILIDVWVKFAEDPIEPADLLITSHEESTSAALARTVYPEVKRPDGAENDPCVAALQNFVAARLYFGEVLNILVPLTSWWQGKQTQAEFNEYLTAGSPKLSQAVDDVIDLRDRWLDDSVPPPNKRSAFERFVAVCTLICLSALRSAPDTGAKTMAASTTLLRETTWSDIETAVLELLRTMHPKPKPMVWRIALNRKATAAIARSVPTVKADAARRVFDVDCSGIDWAILDTGIDEKHPAFGQRVKATYDFTNYRQIISVGNARQQVREMNIKIIEQARGSKLPKGAETKLKKIGQAGLAGIPLPLNCITDMVRLTDPQPPISPHGTHVAGILAARKYTESADSETDSEADSESKSVDGMCPGIGIYDFRVLKSDDVGPRDLENTEFSIIAALQFIRHTNDAAGRLVVKGVNMSLSIPHDVKNYACGRTPICDESERLIDNGVVVVAAAGNKGAEETLIEGVPFYDYLGFGITDPGNADRVITVGSTHRTCPFTYGISYFSSRGPTGDGRLKPDLVAPGEDIHSTVPGSKWDRHDGTSQAAPHVSGAAAMLMARYPELVGDPDRIKRILCDTATDLNRERSFQGHGLVDVLRALQSL